MGSDADVAIAVYGVDHDANSEIGIVRERKEQIVAPSATGRLSGLFCYSIGLELFNVAKRGQINKFGWLKPLKISFHMFLAVDSTVNWYKENHHLNFFPPLT